MLTIRKNMWMHDIDRMEEFLSVTFQYYQDFPSTMQRTFPDMYRLVKESVE